MQRTRLGRSGLEVSRVGLGCGGPSRLGQAYGHSPDASKRVIFRALELGIDFFDTAEQNVRWLSGPPLPPEQLERLERLFGEVSSLSAH